MPGRDNLDEAIARGIIKPEQAEALRSLSGAMEVDPVHKADLELEDDESFRFVSGFNDIFLALGVVMLLYGMTISKLSTGMQGHLLAAVLTWVLAEIFAGWLKRVLPSMIVAAAFVYHSLNIASLVIDNRDFTGFNMMDVFGTISSQPISWYVFATGIGAALVIYFRFKLPFSLFLAGLLSILLVVVEALKRVDGSSYSWFIPFLLAMGVILFAIAMWFDSADRFRVNRLSDNAFWLHLLASPLIVHSIMWQSAIWTIGAKSGNPTSGWEDIATPLAVIVLAVFLVLMVIALVIDRRAMLVSSLIYVSVAITYIITQKGSIVGAASFTPALIGTASIALGVGWRPLRRLIFTILPLGAIENHLPPIRS